MRIVVTCGPSSEPLDRVRRLTNFSTGALGLFLSSLFAEAGHEVICFRGSGATASLPTPVFPIVPFTTTEDLAGELRTLARGRPVDAVFHAAALSDFRVGAIRDEAGRPILSGKISSRAPCVLTLLPAPKLLLELRDLFAGAFLTGWKFEVEGDRTEAIAQGKRQIRAARTDLCVINGPAYGEGFGLLTRRGELLPAVDRECLARLLLERLACWKKERGEKEGSP
ncbi:phosphopantothenate---cysteine ligase (CTP) [Methylacidimicrobium cyclopophantes]|uniref:Phosphopantothenate---cysteine ligase (CTP) n=1 Tax=Methylacidimicrobium cyclopophantes TaxID=1041766 RepID=A0A5E6MR86_9BACT|nr:phosphopantothenoylcysteine decarboxylase [Methylacidimicrobium cyclopophantes]VVM08347.1 phosphopantothenate---cysteine ligase (CTP) [Methylacidimicrobium cyclopophantes]